MHFKAPLVGIRGGGDLASGIAHRLFQAGFPLIISELEHPRMVRRSVCFGEAVWENKISIEKVEAVLIQSESQLSEVLARKYIGVAVDPEGKIFDKLNVPFLVDARMLKREIDDQRRPGRFVVGIGPGFTAGLNVDRVIETMRGHTLGKVIYSGQPLPNTGVPGIIAGESIRRLIKAPCCGVFRAEAELGQMVCEGQIVGWVNEKPVKVLLSGKLRGLIRNGTEVACGEKLGDCDPRGEKVDIYTISDKARAIGGGVLEAVLSQVFA
ncbi:MAG: selenium-dependent molybdenum cofactor biosynthesis protein YqeB [Candidatus Bruticola sp.]